VLIEARSVVDMPSLCPPTPAAGGAGAGDAGAADMEGIDEADDHGDELVCEDCLNDDGAVNIMADGQRFCAHCGARMRAP
jgi:hypothetical protein